MVFSSLTFLFIFLPLTLVVYYLSGSIVTRNVVLLIASLLFYAWGEPVYVILMLLSILANFYLGQDLEANKKKITLVIGIILNLGILGYYKYSGFLLGTIQDLTHITISIKHIALPIGISFYTFQEIAYLVDVYRGKSKAQQNIISFGVYIAMFPKLIQGPLASYGDFEMQLNNRIFRSSDFTDGIILFVKGLAKKVLLADSLGVVHTQILAIGSGHMTALTAWIGAIAYTLQIFNDFSGYTDMAIGIGKMFGFKFPENFNCPYKASSIADFWRRWHMTLSGWFKEYVYIPLGGNRCNTSRQIANLLIVWMLTGLWHGSDWNFIFWGLYYGILLIIEKFLLADLLEKIPLLIRRIITFILVVIGWVFFFSDSLVSAGGYLKAMFFANGLADRTGVFFLFNSIILLVVAFIPSVVKLDNRRKVPGVLKWTAAVLLFAISITFMVGASYSSFLYFKF